MPITLENVEFTYMAKTPYERKALQGCFADCGQRRVCCCDRAYRQRKIDFSAASEWSFKTVGR